MLLTTEPHILWQLIFLSPKSGSIHNRANSALGSYWNGNTGNNAITNNQLAPTNTDA
jgi:hypothetical protein